MSTAEDMTWHPDGNKGVVTKVTSDGNRKKNLILWSIAATSVVIIIIVLLSVYSIRKDNNISMRSVTAPESNTAVTNGAEPETVILLNEGIFIFPETGKEKKITLDEPLPKEARKSVEDALNKLDFSSPGNSGAATLLSTSVSASGKQFILIYPAVFSCDGNVFFDGYIIESTSITVENRPAAEIKARCEAGKTLESARALAEKISNEDPYTKGTFEIFEVGMDQAADIYLKNKQEPLITAPPVSAESIIIPTDGSYGGEA